MGYELAPATQLLATHCCFCSRPLLDATSVQRGYGPTCADKWMRGYDLFEPKVREEINGLVHEASCIQRSEQARIVEIVERLQELGAEIAAGRISDKLVGVPDVEINFLDGRYEVLVHFFDADWVNESRKVPGRRCEKCEIDGKTHWVSAFPASSKRALWACLQLTLSGRLAEGPKGRFII